MNWERDVELKVLHKCYTELTRLKWDGRWRVLSYLIGRLWDSDK